MRNDSMVMECNLVYNSLVRDGIIETFKLTKRRRRIWSHYSSTFVSTPNSNTSTRKCCDGQNILHSCYELLFLSGENFIVALRDYLSR